MSSILPPSTSYINHIVLLLLGLLCSLDLIGGVAFDIPPWTKAGAKCGQWSKIKEVSRGRRFFIVFPKDWDVKTGTSPSVHLSVTTEFKGATYFIHDGVKSNKVLSKQKVKKNEVTESTFSLSKYSESRAYVLVAKKDVKVHVTISWQDSSGYEYAYSYWAVSRAILYKAYYAVTAAADSSINSIGSIVIVNSEYGNTVVNVTLSASDANIAVTYAGTSYTSGEMITDIVISQYSSVIISATAGDLSGTYINANNVIAVFSGNGPSSAAGKRDAQFEQMVPTRAYGIEYLAVIPQIGIVPSGTTVIIKIIAANDATELTVNGITYSIAAGDPFSQTVAVTTFDQFFAVEAKKAVLVTQEIITASNSEALTATALMLVPALSKFENIFKVIPQSGWSYYFYVVMSTEARDAFLDAGASDTQYVLEWQETSGNAGGSVAHSVQAISGSGGSLKDYSAAPGTSGLAVLYIGSASSGSTKYTLIGSHFGSLLPYRRCFPCKGTQCDWRDNDCDGRNNEEICDKKDNDGDGMIDEDCCLLFPPVTFTPGSTSTLTLGGIIAGSLVGIGMLGAIVALAAG